MEGGRGNPHMGEKPRLRKPKARLEQDEGDDEETTDPIERGRAEFEGGRFHPDQHVVFLVLMGIDRVIGQRPRDAAEIEKHSGPGDPLMDGTPADKGAPVEGEPEKDLRPVGETLHEGIDGDDSERGRADDDGRPIELQKDREAGQALQDEEDDGRPDAHLA